MSDHSSLPRVHALRLAAAALPLIAALFGCATSGSTGAGGGGPSTGGTSVSSSESSSVSSSSSGGGTGGSTSSAGGGGAGGGGAGGGGSGGMPPLCGQLSGSADHPVETEQNNLKASANPLPAGAAGFTASICPTGDVDIFSIDVSTPGSSIAASTGDGMGGCPAGAFTLVRVFDAQNQVLGGDAGGGPGNCSLLDPKLQPTLQNLPAGTYYVQVESADTMIIASYALDLQVIVPVCGDGVVQLGAGEQCDDTNQVALDGCSPSCELEGNFAVEVETNDTQDTANLLDGNDGVVAALKPAGDHDYFSFTVTVPGSILVAEVSDGLGGCPAGFDSKLRLFDPSKVEIASDDNSGPGTCSRLDPQISVAAKDLAPGVYALSVEHATNAAQLFYVLKVQVTPPICGDGLRQLPLGEQCDDANTAPGDGCSPSCKLEGTWIAETEDNGSLPTANPLPAGANGFIGAISPIADQDYYSFDVPVAGSSTTIVVSGGVLPGTCPQGFDSKIYLYDPNGVVVAIDDDSGPPPTCSKLSPAINAALLGMPAGTYKLRVESLGNNATTPFYSVSINVSPPGCGDDLIQLGLGEQCDDANQVSGDGCSSSCKSESPFEIEPNGTMPTANTLWPATSTWKGSIKPAGDHDWFKFTLAAPGSPTLVTHDADNPAGCSFDTAIHLVDSNNLQIAYDDDSGPPGGCSKISPQKYAQVQNLPAGTYYVWVQRYADQVVIPLYQLDLSVQ